MLLDEADFLDGQHVVFGKVIYGMNVLKDLENQPLTVDPDYQEYFEEYPEDYEDELEFPINDVRIDACYLSDPEEDIFVELKHKEKTEEPEDYELPGEDEEVFPEEQPVDTEDAVFCRTDPLLYHKFENMVFFWLGNLYSLCSLGNQDYHKIIHF